MKNFADLGECYPRRPSASVDNTLLDRQNSSYPTQPHSIIALLFIQNISRFLMEFRRFALCFSALQNHNLVPGFFSVNGSIICSGLHF